MKKIHLLLLLFASVSMWAQQSVKVSGVVVDESGETLPGVSVIEVGTQNAMMTDLDGNFLISVSSGQASIEFRYVGFESKTVKLNGQTKLNVKLTSQSSALDEVVVVGYGVQKKVNLTGSVTSINFADKMDGRPIVNVSSALAGLAPGMVVSQTSGQPGSDGAKIRIRGSGSFNDDRGANKPLVLVDGIEWDMNDVNPNDIETISVLKDAASAAIYGSRAGGGVILITTKKGQGKPQISYSYSGIVQKPYNDLSFVSDYARYMDLVNEANENVGKAGIFSQGSIDSWRAAALDPNGLNEYGVPNYVAYPNTNWFEEVFNTGYSQQHNLSVSGGSEKAKYLISLGYLDNQGVMNRWNLDSGTDKIDIRTNVEAKVLDWLTVGTRILGQKQNYGLANVSNGFKYLYQTTPGVYPGEPNYWGRPALEGEESTNANNIFGQMAGSTGFNTVFRLNSSFYAIISPFKGFSVEGTFNYSPTFTDKSSYSRQNGYWDYVKDERATESTLERASITNTTGRSYSKSAEVLARYNTTIKEVHDIGVLFGHTASEYYRKTTGISRQGATDWDLHELDTYNELVGSSSDVNNHWTLMSFMGRVNYAYKSKYLFEANVRADGSSRFGKDKRWGYFPSLSLGWRVLEEDFMREANTPFSNLKLRFSYGQAGNNAALDYEWQAMYEGGNVVTEGDGTIGLIQKKISNSVLQWETSETLNVGLDFGFFKNKLTGEIDVYNKLTKDILFNPEFYLTMGNVGQSPENLGKSRNRGIELSLNWQDKIGKDFSYSAGFNISYNTNKVTSFKGKLQKYWSYDENGNPTSYNNNFKSIADGGFSGYIAEGRQLGETYIHRVYKGSGEGYTGGAVDVNAGPRDGMIRTEKDMEWVRAMIHSGYSFAGVNTIGKDQLWYGDLLYANSNQDMNYGDDNDKEFTGHTSIPKYNLGLNLSMTYKGFDVSMLWSAAFGFHLLWNTEYYNSTLVSHGYGIIEHVANDHYFYNPDNSGDSRTNITGKYPRLTYGTTGKNKLESNWYEYKGDYLKLKNMQIGYTLPQKISNKFFASRLRAFASFDNILTITSYPGYDPEMGTTIGYPLMRQISFGAQVTF